MNEDSIIMFDTDGLEIISQFSTINSVTRDCDACSPVAFANAHIFQANSLDFSYQVSAHSTGTLQ